MKLLQNKNFKDLTTICAGGKIRYYLEVRNNKETIDAVSFANKSELPIFILGGGSDILVNDKRFNGLVIKHVGKHLSIKNLKASKVLLTSEAGKNWDELVRYSVKNDFQGIECLSGIPGTVGASPIQNIGAYGQELKQVFVSLTAYDTHKGKFVKFTKKDCNFAYRESVFKGKKYWQRYLITEVTLKLTKGAKPAIKYDSLKNHLNQHGIESPSLHQVRAAVIRIRAGKFESPRKVPNAGSFFKNPILDKKFSQMLLKKYSEVPLIKQTDGNFKGYAGWFIEKAGWKGKTYKGAGVSPRHALILINKGGRAKASDIVTLSEKIISDVYTKFGVRLTKEVQFINFD